MSNDGKDEKRDEAKRAAELAKEDRWFADKDKIGYGHPPAEHRFKKGISANPRGRPPKSARALSVRQYDADILRAGEHEMEITIDGKRTKISLFELLVRKLYMLAGQGNFKAIKMVFEVRKDALLGNTHANIRLHNVVEAHEIKALVNGHYPPNHEIFKHLNYWRKRTRKI
jgi:hypothetical protein